VHSLLEISPVMATFLLTALPYAEELLRCWRASPKAQPLPQPGHQPGQPGQSPGRGDEDRERRPRDDAAVPGCGQPRAPGEFRHAQR
jgi:hypothetical protein